jgi:hypothetical protein
MADGTHSTPPSVNPDVLVRCRFAAERMAPWIRPFMDVAIAEIERLRELERQPCRHERVLDEIAAHCQTEAGASYMRNMLGPREDGA